MTEKDILEIENSIDVDRLARLARFTLTEEERQSLTEELKKMADYTYPRVQSETVAPYFAYGLANNALREDIPEIRSEEEGELILRNAPSREEGYITVPKIIREGAEEI